MIYRFVNSINDMKDGGTALREPAVVSWWTKRFSWYDWVSTMPLATLEIVLIGQQPAEPPFIEYDDSYMAALQKYYKEALRRHGPTPERTILVREVYETYEEAEMAGGYDAIGA